MGVKAVLDIYRSTTIVVNIIDEEYDRQQQKIDEELFPGSSLNDNLHPVVVMPFTHLDFNGALSEVEKEAALRGFAYHIRRIDNMPGARIEHPEGNEIVAAIEGLAVKDEHGNYQSITVGELLESLRNMGIEVQMP